MHLTVLVSLYLSISCSIVFSIIVESISWKYILGIAFSQCSIMFLTVRICVSSGFLRKISRAAHLFTVPSTLSHADALRSHQRSTRFCLLFQVSLKEIYCSPLNFIYHPNIVTQVTWQETDRFVFQCIIDLEIANHWMHWNPSQVVLCLILLFVSAASEILSVALRYKSAATVSRVWSNELWDTHEMIRLYIQVLFCPLISIGKMWYVLKFATQIVCHKIWSWTPRAKLQHAVFFIAIPNHHFDLNLHTPLQVQSAQLSALVHDILVYCTNTHRVCTSSASQNAPFWSECCKCRKSYQYVRIIFLERGVKFLQRTVRTHCDEYWLYLWFQAKFFSLQ